MVDKKTYVEESESNGNNSNNNITAGKRDDVSAAVAESEGSSSPIIGLEIQDIEGIGPTTARKLKEAGIVSVMDLAVTSADELAVEINASKESAAAVFADSNPKNCKGLQCVREGVYYCGRGP